MNRYQITASSVIPAPPGKIYAILADYRQHHPRIVPPRYFRNIQVLEGGVGEGTRTRFTVHVMGQVQEIKHSITEPEPGRVLAEYDAERDVSTTFTVDAADGGKATCLTIATSLPARPGIAGTLERWMTSALLRRIYRKELARIAEYSLAVTL